MAAGCGCVSWEVTGQKRGPWTGAVGPATEPQPERRVVAANLGGTRGAPFLDAQRGPESYQPWSPSSKGAGWSGASLCVPLHGWSRAWGKQGRGALVGGMPCMGTARRPRPSPLGSENWAWAYRGWLAVHLGAWGSEINLLRILPSSGPSQGLQGGCGGREVQPDAAPCWCQ